MFINLIILNLLLNRTPILLFPGLGASRLIKNKVDIWPPKLPLFIINHNKWIDIIINDKELKKDYFLIDLRSEEYKKCILKDQKIYFG